MRLGKVRGGIQQSTCLNDRSEADVSGIWWCNVRGNLHVLLIAYVGHFDQMV